MDLCNNVWDLSVFGLSSPSLDENVLDFSSPSIQSSVVGFEELNASHGKSDMFADWMDEKIDLSILDGLEGQPNILDDLDMMVGDSAALLDNLIDWSSELLGSGYDITDTKKSDLLQQDMQVGGLSPPTSPINKVPDISFAVLPEFKQESLYRQTSDVNNSSAATTTVIPGVKFEKADDFDPSEYVKVEIVSPVNTELDTCTSNSPPLTPVSFVSSTNEYVIADIHSPANTELDGYVSSTPPLTPISFVPSVEYVGTENTMEIKTNDVSIETPHSHSSFVLDSSFNYNSSDNESHELSDVSVKEYNSGNMTLPIEFKADIKSDLQVKKHRSRKRVVPTSNPLVPVEVRRKERKRVQNKDAATRYREKKRNESKAVVDEELTLEKRNKELHNTVDKLSSEISYLKGLLKEAKLRAQSRQKNAI